MLHTLFLWFYCLPIPAMLLLSAGAAFLFLAARDRMGRRPAWRLLTALLLAGAVLGILAQTVLGRTPGDFREPVRTLFASYRAVRGGANPELLRSNLMNVMLFVPAGLLGAAMLPRKLPPVWKVLPVTVLLGALSFGIEYSQYRFGLGLAEADDLFHNTLGALIGSLAVVLWPALRRLGRWIWDRIPA